MGIIPPFSATATASYPTNSFILTPINNENFVFKRFVIKPHPHNIYYYDPYDIPNNPTRATKLLSTLSDFEHYQYRKWRDTLAFNEKYLEFTGRSYLVNYLRDPPKHYMWRADYFNQQHWVESYETHFTIQPPKELLTPILEDGIERRLDMETQPRLLQEYRNPKQSTLNMTLTVLSVVPRVFEIPNFLSKIEVQHLLDLAGRENLKRSSVGATNDNQFDVNDSDGISSTRTSENSWLPREKSLIVDAIYRRAADLVCI